MLEWKRSVPDSRETETNWALHHATNVHSEKGTSIPTTGSTCPSLTVSSGQLGLWQPYTTIITTTAGMEYGFDAEGEISLLRFRDSAMSKLIKQTGVAFGANLFRDNLRVLGLSTFLFTDTLSQDTIEEYLNDVFIICALALHSKRFYLYNLVMISQVSRWHDKLEAAGVFRGPDGQKNLDRMYHFRQYSEGLLHACTVGARQVENLPGDDRNNSSTVWLKRWTATGVSCAVSPCARPLKAPDIPVNGRPFLDVPINDRLAVGVILRRGMLRSDETFKAFGREVAMPCLVTLFPHPYHSAYLATTIGFAYLMHQNCRAQRGKERQGDGGQDDDGTELA